MAAMLSKVSKGARPALSRGFSQALAEPMAWNQAPVVVTTLASGLRVATQKSFGPLASSGVFVDAGVRDETLATTGSAHILEQLALKQGSAHRSAAQVQKEFQSLGGTLEVSAGRERTSFTSTGFKSGLDKSLNLLGHFVTAPATSNFESLRPGIVEALEAKDVPTRAVMEDRLHACAFRDGPLGFSTNGPFEGLEGRTERDVTEYAQANYTSDKVVVSVVGDVAHEEVVEMVEASSLSFLKPGKPAIGVDKPYFCGADLVYRNDEMGPTAYICMGYEGVPHRSPDAVAFMLMANIIGGYKKNSGLVPGKISGNRTVNAVANKMDVGCADEFEGFNRSYKDTGVFGFYAACDEVAVEHCVGELQFAINLLAFSVTEEEVARGKREMLTKLFSGTGSTASKCAENGSQVVSYGRGIPAAEWITRVNAIDAEEIKRVAWQYLNDAEVAITALGPLHGLPTYLELRRATGMHRY